MRGAWGRKGGKRREEERWKEREGRGREKEAAYLFRVGETW